MNHHLTLEVLPKTYCVCKNIPNDLVQDLIDKSDFFSFIKTADEVSLVVPQEIIPYVASAFYEKDWKIFKVIGVLDFSLVGILSLLSTTLANAGISIFALSTFNTDYILVKEDTLSNAADVLKKEGYTILL